MTQLVFLNIFHHFNSLVSARNKAICHLLVPVGLLYFHPLLHVVNNLIITPKSFTKDGTFEGSKEMETWGSKIWAVRWAGARRVLPNSVSASSAFKSVCGCVLPWWRRISATFLWGQTLQKSFGKVLIVRMYTSELMVWPHGVMSTKINPSTSQKWWPWFSSSRGSLKLLLLPSRSCTMPFQWLSLVCSSKWWIHFYVHGSMQCQSMSIIVQRDATTYSFIIFLQTYYISAESSTCFGWYPHSSSGAHSNCNYNIWHWSNRICYCPLTWRSQNFWLLHVSRR